MPMEHGKVFQLKAQGWSKWQSTKRAVILMILLLFSMTGKNDHYILSQGWHSTLKLSGYKIDI